MANNEENKSIFKKLQEGLFNIRVLPRPDKLDNTGIAKDGQTLPDILNDELSDISSGLNLSELEKFKTLSNDRELQCEALEEMLNDPEIAKALKMYADDATQADQEGRIIWVESDDPEVASYGNKLLKDLNIAELANPTIYSMCLYGDCYWKLFENISETNPDISVLTEPLMKGGADIHTQAKVRGSTLRRYIERMSNPAVIYELKKRDKTCGFIKLPDRQNTLNTTSQTNYTRAFNANLQNNAMDRKLKVMRPNKFIHFYIPDPSNRFPEQINLTNSELESESYIFDVAKGKSAIADLYKTYQQLKLMEDSLLLNRVTRSSIIRLLSIEVGDAPKSKIPLMIKRLKDKMEQKNLIDKNSGTFKSQAAPGPMENIIFTTMKDGKGAISAQNIGGDVNVGELSDYDTFANKKYALLGIPKGMLAQDMDGSGLSNGGSLTELSAPYARFIMSLKQIYMNTVKNLIDIFIIDDKLEDTHLGNFEVRMTPLVTIEDVRRDEVFGQRIDSINNFMSLLDTVGEDEEGTPIINPAKKKEILTYFVNNYLSRPEIAEIIDEESEDEELEETDTGFTNTGSEDSEFGGFSGGGFDNFGDTEVPEIGGEEIPEETPSDSTETAAVDSNIDIGAESDDEGFGDF